MENDDNHLNKRKYRIDRKIFFWSLNRSLKMPIEELPSIDKEGE